MIGPNNNSTYSDIIIIILLNSIMDHTVGLWMHRWHGERTCHGDTRVPQLPCKTKSDMTSYIIAKTPYMYLYLSISPRKVETLEFDLRYIYMYIYNHGSM